MELNFSLKADDITISKLSEESESNESLFIRNFCTDILKQIATKTKEICETARKMNMENPYGFPDL